MAVSKSRDQHIPERDVVWLLVVDTAREGWRNSGRRSSRCYLLSPRTLDPLATLRREIQREMLLGVVVRWMLRFPSAEKVAVRKADASAPAVTRMGAVRQLTITYLPSYHQAPDSYRRAQATVLPHSPIP